MHWEIKKEILLFAEEVKTFGASLILSLRSSWQHRPRCIWVPLENGVPYERLLNKYYPLLNV
jgi:hypothetical protein